MSEDKKLKFFQIDEYNKSEIQICLMVTKLCNFKCKYCCALNSDTYKNTLQYNKNSISFNTAKFFIDKFSEIKSNVILNILGGEPTLHKDLNSIIDYASKFENIKIIEVSTNGIFADKINKNNKLRVIFTYHPSEIKDTQKFLKNVLKCYKDGINFEVNIMIPQDRYYKNINEIFNKLKLFNIEAIPVYPFTENFKLQNKIYDCEKDAKYYILNGHKVSLREIYLKDLNKFKGWNCDNQAFIVAMNGDIQQCSEEVIGNINDIRGFDFLAYRYQICKCERCNYEGFLRSYKNTKTI